MQANRFVEKGQDKSYGILSYLILSFATYLFFLAYIY